MSLHTTIRTIRAAWERSSAAYAADIAVQDGLCAGCKTRKVDPGKRVCWTCQREGVKSK